MWAEDAAAGQREPPRRLRVATGASPWKSFCYEQSPRIRATDAFNRPRPGALETAAYRSTPLRTWLPAIAPPGSRKRNGIAFCPGKTRPHWGVPEMWLMARATPSDFGAYICRSPTGAAEMPRKHRLFRTFSAPAIWPDHDPGRCPGLANSSPSGSASRLSQCHLGQSAFCAPSLPFANGVGGHDVLGEGLSPGARRHGHADFS